MARHEAAYDRMGERANGRGILRGAELPVSGLNLLLLRSAR